MGWTKWALGGVALFVASGAVAFGIVSTGGGTASAQTPDQGRGRFQGTGRFERHAELLAEKLNISVEKLRAAQKAAIEQLRGGGNPPREPGAYDEALAKQLGISVEILRVAQKAALDQAINEAIAAGRLTPQQAERMKDMAGGFGSFGGPGGASGRPGLERLGKGVMHALQSIVGAAADVIGIPEDKLKEELRSGKSIAEIADANKVDRNKLEDGMIKKLEAAIDKARADGMITQEQADRLKKGLNDRIDQIVEHKGGMKGPGMGMQRMGPGGMR